MQKIKELGLVQVFTGTGKGKTTAALGLTMRALGHGFRVHMIQFMKGRDYAGELAMAAKLAPLFTISQFGRGGFVKDRGIDPEDLEYVRRAVSEAEEFMQDKACDILILDEIGNVLRYKMLTIEQVLDLIRKKPANMELVLTGRGIPEEIMDAADLVTEMKEVKHPFKKGVGSRRGVEY